MQENTLTEEKRREHYENLERCNRKKMSKNCLKQMFTRSISSDDFRVILPYRTALFQLTKFKPILSQLPMPAILFDIVVVVACI